MVECDANANPPCYDDDTAYATFDLAWAACAQDTGCFYITKVANGTFRIRRETDPLSAVGGSATLKIWTYSCPCKKKNPDRPKKIYFFTLFFFYKSFFFVLFEEGRGGGPGGAPKIFFFLQPVLLFTYCFFFLTTKMACRVGGEGGLRGYNGDGGEGKALKRSGTTLKHKFSVSC